MSYTSGDSHKTLFPQADCADWCQERILTFGGQFHFSTFSVISIDIIDYILNLVKSFLDDGRVSHGVGGPWVMSRSSSKN